MSELQDQLKTGFGKSQWQDLAPHAARDALIVIHPSLDLLMVGEMIAQDNVALINKWMANHLVRKPTLTELENWSRDPDREFPTLIVQPFVLVSGDLDEQ